MEKIRCPYCGYTGGFDYGINLPYFKEGIPKLDCAKCKRTFRIKLTMIN